MSPLIGAAGRKPMRADSRALITSVLLTLRLTCSLFRAKTGSCSLFIEFPIWERAQAESTEGNGCAIFTMLWFFRSLAPVPVIEEAGVLCQNTCPERT